MPSNIGLIKEFKDTPFSFEEQLNNLFTDGTLSAKEWDLYSELKSNYSTYVNTIITFFDAPNIKEIQKNNYDFAIDNIKKLLQEATKKI